MENELSQRTFPFRCGYLLKIANQAGVNSLKPFRPFRAVTSIWQIDPQLLDQWFPARTTEEPTEPTDALSVNWTFAANLNWPSRRCRMQLQDASPERTLPSSPSEKPSSEAKCIFQRDKPISAGVIGTGNYTKLEIQQWMIPNKNKCRGRTSSLNICIPRWSWHNEVDEGDPARAQASTGSSRKTWTLQARHSAWRDMAGASLNITQKSKKHIPDRLGQASGYRTRL